MSRATWCLLEAPLLRGSKSGKSCGEGWFHFAPLWVSQTSQAQNPPRRVPFIIALGNAGAAQSRPSLAVSIKNNSKDKCSSGRRIWPSLITRGRMRWALKKLHWMVWTEKSRIKGLLAQEPETSHPHPGSVALSSGASPVPSKPICKLSGKALCPRLLLPPCRVLVLSAAPQPSFLVEGGPAALHGSPELPQKIQPASEADWPGTCLSLPSPPLCTAPCPLQSSLQRHFSR